MRILFTVLVFLSSSTTFSQVKRNVGSNEVHINIQIQDAEKNDTLFLVYRERIINVFSPVEYFPVTRVYALLDSDNLFHFTLDSIRNPGYCSIIYRNRNNNTFNILNNYLIETNDNLLISLRINPTWDKYLEGSKKYAFPIQLAYPKKYTVRFLGFGAEKYTYQYEMDHVSHSFKFIDSTDNFDGKKYDSALNEGLQKLDVLKLKLEPTVFDVLKSDILASFLLNKMTALKEYALTKDSSFTSPGIYGQFERIKYYSDSIEGNISIKAKSISQFYASYAIYKMQMNKNIVFRNDSAINVYNLLIKNYDSLLRDKIIALFILNDFTKLPNAQELLERSLPIVKDVQYRSLLLKFKETHSQRQAAYNFQLPDVKGNTISLKDLRGKVVFVDFWYTGCPGCSIFYKQSLAEVEQMFKTNPGVIFVTISIDKDKSIWAQSIHKLIYTSPDIINLYTGGQGIDHPLLKFYNITSFPYLMMIDVKGKIYRMNNLRLPPKELMSVINEALNCG